MPLRLFKHREAPARLVLVAYDIASPKRWRRVHKLMLDHGDRVQYSVFQCRLTDPRRHALVRRLKETVKLSEDRVLLIDLGTPAEAVGRLETIGTPLPSAEITPIVA